MKKIYLLWSSSFYHDAGCDNIAFLTKSAAEKWVRAKGFIYNKREDLFLNEEKQYYYRIEEGKLFE